MKRIIIFIYGLACYIFFLFVFLYGIGFLGNFVVPRSIDSGPESSVGSALLVNTGLLSLFAVQHSVMARKWFKRWWTRYIPEPAERSTYVLFSSVALFTLFWFWQPLGGVIWDVSGSASELIMHLLYFSGWILVLVTTFMINHFDLFGLRQVYLYLVGKEYTELEFQIPFLYRYVRHPLYVGWLLVFWSTPRMTAAHMFFAVVTTAYILVAIQFEERDLMERFGKKYREYSKKVPMLVPGFKPGSRDKMEEAVN